MDEGASPRVGEEAEWHGVVFAVHVGVDPARGDVEHLARLGDGVVLLRNGPHEQGVHGNAAVEVDHDCSPPAPGADSTSRRSAVLMSPAGCV